MVTKKRRKVIKQTDGVIALTVDHDYSLILSPH